jgi:catechol 2,3-dioxygenase-like lactoylglutathione lyase family enzyme
LQQLVNYSEETQAGLMSTQIDYYPMPAFTRLVVKDLERSARWYEKTLGFQNIFFMPGPAGVPLLVHLRWAKYADLLLVAESPQTTLVGQRGTGVTLYFQASDPSVDEIAGRAKEKRANIVEGPINRPWNAREVLIRDPDGYLLAFTEGPVDPGAGMERIMARLQQGKSK